MLTEPPIVPGGRSLHHLWRLQADGMRTGAAGRGRGRRGVLLVRSPIRGCRLRARRHLNLEQGCAPRRTGYGTSPNNQKARTLNAHQGALAMGQATAGTANPNALKRYTARPQGACMELRTGGRWPWDRSTAVAVPSTARACGVITVCRTTPPPRSSLQALTSVAAKRMAPVRLDAGCKELACFARQLCVCRTTPLPRSSFQPLTSGTAMQCSAP